MTIDVRDTRKVLPSISSHQTQKFLGEEQRLVRRALETDSPGLEFLLSHLIADGKVGRTRLQITELRCCGLGGEAPYAIQEGLGHIYMCILGKIEIIEKVR